MVGQFSMGEPGQGYVGQVVNRFSSDGFTIDEGAYSWGPGAEMMASYDMVELHYRVSPARVRAQVSTGSSKECSMGRLLLIPPLSMRARAADEAESVQTVLCRFDRQWLEEVAGTRLDWRPDGMAAYADIVDVDIEAGMRRLAEEVSRVGRLATDAMIAGLSQCLAVDLARRYAAVGDQADNCEAAFILRRLNRVQEMVREAQDRMPSLAEIAAECQLSPTYLRRVFRAGTGQTLHKFLDEARISMACRLLRETECALKIISYRVGFSHHSAFTYSFRQHLGVTPKDYRARFG